MKPITNPTVRAQSEILSRIEAVKEQDIFGVMATDLTMHLEHGHAISLAGTGLTAVSKAEWDSLRSSTCLDPMQAMASYLSFAWGKANDCKGLSAIRSIHHMSAWLWLAGFDELLEELEDYQYYGKPQLVMCSVLCSVDWQKHDDGRWTNDSESAGIHDDLKHLVADQYIGYAEQALKSRQPNQ